MPEVFLLALPCLWNLQRFHSSLPISSARRVPIAWVFLLQVPLLLDGSPKRVCSVGMLLKTRPCALQKRVRAPCANTHLHAPEQPLLGNSFLLSSPLGNSEKSEFPLSGFFRPCGAVCHRLFNGTQIGQNLSSFALIELIVFCLKLGSGEGWNNDVRGWGGSNC